MFLEYCECTLRLSIVIEEVHESTGGYACVVLYASIKPGKKLKNNANAPVSVGAIGAIGLENRKKRRVPS